MPITFNNPSKVCFSNKKFILLSKHKRSIFLNEKPVLAENFKD